MVGDEAKQFVHELADNQHGISLAYLYHSDSLKSGNSYSNEQHIKLKDHVDVRRERERERIYLILYPFVFTGHIARFEFVMKTFF